MLIYDAVVAADIPHEVSGEDLLLPVTRQTIALVAQHRTELLLPQIHWQDNAYWYTLPFAYQPAAAPTLELALCS